MKREKLAKFMNISVRTYSNWKNNEHKNIILLLNLIFKDEYDIFLWTKYGIIPQYKYFENQHEVTDSLFRKRMCILLGIKTSNYYFWKNGKRSNIIELCIQVFRNSENIDYWLINNKFEILINNAKINEYVELLDEINNNEFCTDSFIRDSSSFHFKSINLNELKNYITISMNCNSLNTHGNIKYQIINSIKLSNNIEGNCIIKEYKNFIDKIDKVDNLTLKQLFEEINIYAMFISSIKTIDLNLFVKLLLFITIDLDIYTYFKYLDFILENRRENLYSKMKFSNIDLNIKELQIDILGELFAKIISSLYTLNLNDSLRKRDRDNYLIRELAQYSKIT